jgi:hypothetical protein
MYVYSTVLEVAAPTVFIAWLLTYSVVPKAKFEFRRKRKEPKSFHFKPITQRLSDVTVKNQNHHQSIGGGGDQRQICWICKFQDAKYYNRTTDERKE